VPAQNEVSNPAWRQLLKGIDYQHSRRQLVALDRPCHPDAEHARSIGRFHSVHCIFNDRTRVGRHTEPACGKFEDLRVRLAARHVRTGHHAGKLLTPVKLFQTQRDILRRAGRTDRHEKPVRRERIDQFDRPVHRREATLQHFAKEGFFPLVELANLLERKIFAESAAENVAAGAPEIGREIGLRIGHA
jgi:hypothetical protein